MYLFIMFAALLGGSFLHAASAEELRRGGLPTAAGKGFLIINDIDGQRTLSLSRNEGESVQVCLARHRNEFLNAMMREGIGEDEAADYGRLAVLCSKLLKQLWLRQRAR